MVEGLPGNGARALGAGRMVSDVSLFCTEVSWAGGFVLRHSGFSGLDICGYKT